MKARVALLNLSIGLLLGGAALTAGGAVHARHAVHGPTVAIMLPTFDSSLDRGLEESVERDPIDTVHIRAESNSEKLTFTEWLEQQWFDWHVSNNY